MWRHGGGVIEAMKESNGEKMKAYHQRNGIENGVKAAANHD